jgi:hypothetical protein
MKSRAVIVKSSLQTRMKNGLILTANNIMYTDSGLLTPTSHFHYIILVNYLHH